MQDVIVIAILVIAVLYGVRGTVKHFRGEGGCCGGSGYKPKRKRLRGKIVATYVFHIEGMHCQNCANTVTGVINDIDGACAKVNLRKKQAKVLCNKQIDVKKIIENVEKKGYTIAIIEDSK